MFLRLYSSACQVIRQSQPGIVEEALSRSLCQLFSHLENLYRLGILTAAVEKHGQV